MQSGTYLISSVSCEANLLPVASLLLASSGSNTQVILGGTPNCNTGADLTKYIEITPSSGPAESLIFTQGQNVSGTFPINIGGTYTLSGTAEAFNITSTASAITFTISVYVENECGEVSPTVSKTFSLQIPPPFVKFTSSQQGNTGVFDFTSQAFAQGCIGGITSYLWEVPSLVLGTDYSFTNGTTSASTNPQITFNSYGTFSVKLTVTSSCGSSSAINAITYYNMPPQAQNPSVSGAYSVGNLLTSTYTYFDSEGDLEGASIRQWIRSNDSNGLINRTLVGTNNTYTIVSADENKYLFVEITPYALTGNLQGAKVGTTPMLVSASASVGIHDRYHDTFHS